MKSIEVTYIPPQTTANIDAVEAELKENLANHTGLVVTPDNEKDMRKVRAEINKSKGSVAQVRKQIERQHKEAIAPLISRLKGLEALHDKPIGEMDAQLNFYVGKRLDTALTLLGELLIKLCDEHKLPNEWRDVDYSDLVKAGSLTPTENLTGAAKKELEKRVLAKVAAYQTIERRLLELELESHRAGLSAPLTREHVAHFLHSDDDTYADSLSKLLAVEREREERIQKARSEEQAQAMLAGASVAQTMQQPQPEAEPEQQPEQQPEAKSESAEYPAMHEDDEFALPFNQQKERVTLTCEFEPSADLSHLSDEQIEAAFRQQMADAGFTSLSNIKVNRTLKTQAA